MTLSRRGLLGALAAAFAAPAIVKVGSLMKLAPTKVLRPDGISMRMISNYNLADDVRIKQLDVLYGYMHVRPEWFLTLDDYSERILAPMVNTMQQNVAEAVMRGTGTSHIWYDEAAPVSEPAWKSIPIGLKDLLVEARAGATSAIE